MSQKQVLRCQFQVLDNHGMLNCLAIDGTVGQCGFQLCPLRLQQIRQILKQVLNDDLRVFCRFNPVLMKAAVKRKQRR